MGAMEPSLGSILEFMRVLWAVDHGLQSASKRMENRLGITGPQRLVVRIVGRFPGISAGRLAEILHAHPSTLTGVLQRLEKRGALERKIDPTDNRRALFTLTAKGRSIDQIRSGTIEASVRRALAKVPAARLAATRDVLLRISAELEKER